MKLKNINYKRMDDLITYIAEENKIKKVKVYFDFFLNAAIRGIGYVDYLKGNYINLSNEVKIILEEILLILEKLDTKALKNL